MPSPRERREAQVDAMNADPFGNLYNSRLEAGIRAVVVLECLRPGTADLSEMVLFDHVVVHTADVGGPPSLHAKVPARKGELLVRRRLVEAGLELMQRCHLVERQGTELGLEWRASEEAASYVALLEEGYSTHLRTCAEWVGHQVRAMTKDRFRAFARAELGDWAETFGPHAGPRGRLD